MDTYIVEIAVCYPKDDAGGHWDLEVVRCQVDESAGEATEGEILDAAIEEFEQKNPLNGHVAIGMFSYLRITDEEDRDDDDDA